MKTNIFTASFLFFTAMFAACKKDVVPPGAASLTIINAVVGSSPLVTNFGNSYVLDGSNYASARRIAYGSFNTNYQFSAYSGDTHLVLYQYPDTLAHSNPLYNLDFNLPVGSTHTLFLTGLVTAPDTLFTADNPPYHSVEDSTVGVRFVNLSPGSNPVSITLSTNSAVNEFSNIPYKGITDFKNYPATADIESYTFQFRDASTGDLLASYRMSGINNGTGTNASEPNDYRFRNFTIALKGLTNVTSGTTRRSAFIIYNY